MVASYSYGMKALFNLTAVQSRSVLALLSWRV